MSCFPTPGFVYRDGILCAEDVPLTTIAAEIGTPTYVYSTAGLTANWHAYADAFADQGVSICFALKANSNRAIVRHLAQLGAGADVVSAGEMLRALDAGIPAGRIIFSGVGKTADEIAAALQAGVHQLNVESLPELHLISKVASALGMTAPIALRVNPDVDAGTHAKIATGRKEDKFGIDMAHAGAAYAQATTMPGLRPLGIAIHIGSQLLSVSPFTQAFQRAAGLVRTLRAEGLTVERLDLGGGLGVPYRLEDRAPDYKAYAEAIRSMTQGLDCQIAIEPGRSLVANAGILLARALFVKEGLHRRFLILDAAMNDLIRPSLYEAWHTILPVRAADPNAILAPYDVVGPVCESGDTFARERMLPPIASGDLVAFLTAGAYGAVMASSYNSRPLVPEVMVSGDCWSQVRRRLSVAEMMAMESVPDWIGSAPNGAKAGA